MIRTAVFLLLGVSGGFAFATFMGGGSGILAGGSSESLDALQGRRAADELLPLVARLERIETALDSEIALRQSLEAELVTVIEQMAELRVAASERDPQDDTGEIRRDEFDRAAIQDRMTARAGDRRNGVPDRRLNQLVEAGFPPDQAQRITVRESELRLEALYAQYDAVREGEPFDPRAERFDPQDQLREELGDASYEQYLEAIGRSTSIGVRRVMEGSAGQTAGLQIGDEVITYAGERVFSTSDLNQLILQGAPGQTVVMDVLRDGQQIQVYVPRGPIGISGGGRGGR